MINKNLFFAFLFSIASISSLCAQEFKDHMSDVTWTFYNKNIQSFNNQRLGESLKYGLDDQYVDNLISEDHPMYHEIKSFHKETYSLIDFSKEINKSYYKFEFDKDQTLTVQEVLIYLADKYSAFFEGPEQFGYVAKVDAKKRIEEFQLNTSHKLIIRERWYYHNNRGKMVSRIMDIGLIPDASKSNTAALWIDFSYMKFVNMERIKPKNIEGIINIIDYLEQPTFTRDFYQVNYSTYEGQKKLYKFSTQIDAYFWKYQLDNKFREYQLDKSINKKWKKNKVKTDELVGLVNDKKEKIGKWEIWNSKGKKMGVYTISNANANGAYELFHSNGNLKEKGSLIEGRKNDTIFTFDNSGNKLGWQVYQLGELNGDSKFYHKNGNLHSECQFVNDSLFGKFSSFYPDAAPHTSGVCKKGYFYGNWTLNIKLNEVMCGFLADENNYSQLSSFFEINALDDCTATFDIFFKHRIARECYRGICVIPEFKSLIR